MKHAFPFILVVSLSALILVSVKSLLAQDGKDSTATTAATEELSKTDEARIEKNFPTTIAEARGRARILHETLHGSLQVMHRDFFREDEGLKIPSRSLEDVFSELARSYYVKVHWIAVDLKAMNVDNEPKTDFEKAAVLSLKSGKKEFESLADDEFRFAAKIRLSSTCLSCHASRRSSNDDRFAGLVITMPIDIEK